MMTSIHETIIDLKLNETTWESSLIATATSFSMLHIFAWNRKNSTNVQASVTWIYCNIKVCQLDF